MYRMIYEQNCYDLNDNLMEINIKTFLRFKYSRFL